MLHTLPEELIDLVCSYVGVYNHSLSLVSSLFRRITKRYKPSLEEFRNHLFREGKLRLISRFNLPFVTKNIEESVWNGHFHVLIWAHKRVQMTPTLSHSAVKYLPILVWLKKNNYPFDEETASLAARNNQLDNLKWLRKNGCPWSSNACVSAAINGHLEVLKWLRENGCPWNAAVCNFAAYGFFETLKWARENGCPWNEWSCNFAVSSNRLDILKWLRENGCPWSEITFLTAVDVGNIEILNWLRDNGCPFDHSIYELAFSKGDENVLRWLTCLS